MEARARNLDVPEVEIGGQVALPENPQAGRNTRITLQNLTHAVQVDVLQMGKAQDQPPHHGRVQELRQALVFENHQRKELYTGLQGEFSYKQPLLNCPYFSQTLVIFKENFRDLCLPLG